MAAEDYHTDFYDPPEPSDPEDFPDWKEEERNMAKRVKKPTMMQKAIEESVAELGNKIRRELELALKFNPMVVPQTEDEFVWKTGKGTVIHPREMDEEHLRNSISYTQRKVSHALANAVFLAETTWLVRALYEFLKEAKRRGIRV